MKPKELSRYESQAVKAATVKVLPDLFNALCTAMFENGEADLNELTPEKFDKLCKYALDGGEVERVMVSAFEARAESIKKQIDGNEPPF